MNYKSESVHEASEVMNEMEDSIKTVKDTTREALGSANLVNEQAEFGALMS